MFKETSNVEFFPLFFFAQRVSVYLEWTEWRPLVAARGPELLCNKPATTENLKTNLPGLWSYCNPLQRVVIPRALIGPVTPEMGHCANPYCKTAVCNCGFNFCERPPPSYVTSSAISPRRKSGCASTQTARETAQNSEVLFNACQHTTVKMFSSGI